MPIFVTVAVTTFTVNGPGNRYSRGWRNGKSSSQLETLRAGTTAVPARCNSTRHACGYGCPTTRRPACCDDRSAVLAGYPRSIICRASPTEHDRVSSLIGSQAARAYESSYGAQLSHVDRGLRRVGGATSCRRLPLRRRPRRSLPHRMSYRHQSRCRRCPRTGPELLHWSGCW